MKRLGALLAALGLSVAAVTAVGVAASATATIKAGNVARVAGAASSEYTGPFTTAQHVPSVCLTSVAQTRYYIANIPSGTVETRTGGHGHGGYLKCIYIYLDGPAMYPGDHPYGKWIIFPGLGWLIPQPNGAIVNYQDCFQHGTTNGLPYHFPGPPSIGPMNDCGESYLSVSGGTWFYPGTSMPMYPATTP